MTGKPRFNLPGVPQHIIQRGNYREPCFNSAEDYRRYLVDLKQSALKYHCHIHAYVLMTNHIHLLVTPMVENGVSQMMQALGSRYVKYVNTTCRLSGDLWQGCYKSSLIDSDYYLLSCMCYIELNPVRANLVESPGDYRWSSYQQNAYSGKDDLIENHPVYTMLGQNSDERQYVYRGLFQRHIDNDIVHQIRDALNHELVLGRVQFKDKIEEINKRQMRLGIPGRPRVKEQRARYLILG